jgi:hypothetical protein
MKKRQALRNPVLLLPTALILLLAACHPEPVMPQDARVLIISPSAESTQSAGTVDIRTYVERLKLVDGNGQPNTPGEGHIIYYLDVTPSLEPGKSALAGEGTYAISTDTTYTWDNLASGRHTFWVQLVNNDDTPLTPPQAVRVYVTVE